MKRLLGFAGVLVLITAGEVSAQSRALKAAEGRGVFVIDEDRREWQGRLVRVSADALEVESDAGIKTFSLAGIRRVDADADEIGDGFLKGFGVGAVLGLLIVAGDGPAQAILAEGLVFGLIGLAIDGGCTARHPVFHGAGTPKLDQPPTSSSPRLAVNMRLRW